MRTSQVVGIILVLLGLATLYLLREPLFRLIILILEFIGIAIGIALVFVGLGLIFGGWWIQHRWAAFALEGAGRADSHSLS